jgi:hypothetical protein
MLYSVLMGVSIPLVILVIFLIVFRKKLRETREREGSIYQRVFKRNK